MSIPCVISGFGLEPGDEVTLWLRPDEFADTKGTREKAQKNILSVIARTGGTSVSDFERYYWLSPTPEERRKAAKTIRKCVALLMRNGYPDYNETFANMAPQLAKLVLGGTEIDPG